jgi:hypothetical protein
MEDAVEIGVGDQIVPGVIGDEVVIAVVFDERAAEGAKQFHGAWPQKEEYRIETVRIPP